MAEAGRQEKRKSARASGKASGKAGGGGGSIFDRLTDTSQYTGAHKHRFDADGKGKGLAGRDRVAKGRGSTGRGCSSKGPVVRNIGDILRTDAPAAPAAPAAARRHSQGEGKPKPRRASGAAAKPSASAASPKRKSARASGKAGGGGGGSIFDRLTDPSQYTGAHKHRFDADGKGKGLAGRDSVTKGGGAGRHRGTGAVADLSQITRSNLN